MAMSGGGGGGDTFVPYSSEYFTYYSVGPALNTDFLATIATLPGGVVLTYNAPAAGDEDWLTYVDGTNQLGQLVLHNTTRGTSGLVADCVVGTNTISLSAAVPAGWQVGDTITLRSQTCDIGAAAYYFDLDISGVVPATATIVYVAFCFRATAAGGSMTVHPYETYGAGKAFGGNNHVANIAVSYYMPLPVVSQRICFRAGAPAGQTINVLWIKLQGWELPA